MRASAGDFDPWSAEVYRPKRITLSSGETSESGLEAFLSTRIKSPRGLYTQERDNQGHAQSVSDLVIEVTNEGGGDRLTADMKIKHRDRWFEIRGTLRADWQKRTTLYQVVEINDFSASIC